MRGRAGKQAVFLVTVLLLTIACVSGVAHAPSVYTVAVKVTGSWNCHGAASPEPMTAILLPPGMKAQFTHSNPEFSFEGVPDGDYTLVACCYCSVASQDRDDNKMPITVSGADVSVHMVLPYPALPKRSPVGTLTGHTWSVLDLTFSPDGAELVSASKDGSFIRWDLVTDEGQTMQHGHPHRDAILSRDGETLAVATMAHGMIELWDTERKERLHALQGSSEVVRPLAFSPNGMMLAVEEKDARSGHAQITLWDVATGDALRALDAGQSIKLVRDWYFSQDDTTMISLLEDEQRRTNVVWWDVATGERLRSWSLADIEDTTHRNVHKIAVSPDEALFAFGLSGVEFFGGLVIWDVSTGPVATNDYPTSACDLAFSPDGTLIALTAHSNTIVLWDTGTAEARYVLVSDSSGLCEIAWSPDGKRLAAGAGDGTIVLWEAP